MPEERVVRRLAAILAADMVGYSRLIGRDPEGTVARLKAHRRELIDPKIAEYRGRIVHTSGDGILIEFPSIIEAVSCALAVQRGMAERNAMTPEEERIVFRVGINFGDIIVDDDIHGDGINIAARLEQLAEPGGICISEDTFRQVRGKFGADFEDIGEHNLKNIARPVRAYRLRLRGRSEAAPASPTLPARPSIAVLPFQNLSGDPEQDYFADGMVEEIITALSRIRWLFVSARNSSFIYKGKAVDVKQVGRELSVRYVLEGSVRKAGGRARVTAQLIEAETGAHLWADHFDGSLEDVFALQDRVATSLCGAIEAAVQAAEQRRQRAAEPPRPRQEAERSGSATSDETIVRPRRPAAAGQPPTGRAQALATEPQEIDETVLTTLQRRLAHYVGSIAKALVDSTMEKAQSVEALCELLAENIHSSEKRRAFLREARRECGMYAPAAAKRPPATAGGGRAPSDGTGSDPLPVAIPPATVALAQAELARIIGPIAQVLVKRALSSCATTADLWAKLAEHIEQPDERAAFLRRRPGSAAPPNETSPRLLRRRSPSGARGSAR
jgi:TolB-like protein